MFSRFRQIQVVGRPSHYSWNLIVPFRKQVRVAAADQHGYDTQSSLYFQGDPRNVAFSFGDPFKPQKRGTL